MKKQILISLIMFCSVWSTNAQWSGTSPVWTNSNVGIGNTNPVTLLQIGNGGNSSLVGDELFRISQSAITTTGVKTALHIDANPSSSIFDRGVAIELGQKSSTYGAYTSRIVHFGFSATTRASKLQLQTHSVTSGVWNTGILIDDAGNIGIGTSTPSARLELFRGTNETLKIDRQSGFASVKATSSNYGWLILDSYGSGSGGVSLNHYATDNVYLAIGGGKVGIGTSTPTEKLEINGSIKVAKAANGYDFSKCGLIVQNSTQTDNVSVNSIALATSAANNYGYTINAARTTSGNGSLDIRYHNNSATGTSRFFLSENGSIGIGTTAPAYKLAVKGSIGCSEVQVLDVSAWSDYVFAPDYTLKSLSEVEAFINQNLHLPDVPSEKEVKANGYDVSEMNAILLQKIEELTLYAITQQKEIESVKAENAELKSLKLEFEEFKQLINHLNK